MKIRLTILSLFWAVFALSQVPDPGVTGVSVTPAPTAVGEVSTFGFNFFLNTPTGIPYSDNELLKMRLRINTNKWKPIYEEDGVTPIVYSETGTHLYFDWTSRCVSQCDDDIEENDIWEILGTQNQDIPGTTPPPNHSSASGFVYMNGVAIAEATIAEANTNNGVGFIININPRPGFNDSTSNDSAKVYTHTVERCTAPPAEGTPATTYVGITTLERNTQNWLASAPDNQLGSYIALESTNKGFVITRMPDPETAIANPVEGMVVWDTTEHCLKLYKGIEEGWSCTSNACN